MSVPILPAGDALLRFSRRYLNCLSCLWALTLLYFCGTPLSSGALGSSIFCCESPTFLRGGNSLKMSCRKWSAYRDGAFLFRFVVVGTHRTIVRCYGPVCKNQVRSFVFFLFCWAGVIFCVPGSGKRPTFVELSAAALSFFRRSGRLDRRISLPPVRAE